MSCATRCFIVFIIALVGTVGGSCTYNDPQHKEVESYAIFDQDILEDCNIYGMFFSRGEYSLRIALSGPCIELTREQYLSHVDSFLKKTKDRIVLAERKVLYEFHEKFKVDDYSVQQLMKTTATILGAEVQLLERDVFHVVIAYNYR